MTNAQSSFLATSLLLAEARAPCRSQPQLPATDRSRETTLHWGKKLVHAVAFSHDGRSLFTAGADGGVRVWDVTAGWKALKRKPLPIEFSSPVLPIHNSGCMSQIQTAAQSTLCSTHPVCRLVARRPIVFTSDRDRSSDLYPVKPDGTGLEQLTGHPAFDDQAAFSPDSKRSVFVRTRAEGRAKLRPRQHTTMRKG